MWRIRPPRNPGDKLWQYIADLRRGDDHDPDEEFRSLMPTARLVSEALQGGRGTGPEHLSEARLMEAISRSEERQRITTHRRVWAGPVFAASGWALASIAFTVSAYQLGIMHGVSRTTVAAIPPTAPPVVAHLPQPEPIPVEPVPEAVKEPENPQPKEDEPVKPVAPSPPPVRADEVRSPDESLALFPFPMPDENAEGPQNDLLREGESYLAQGKWEEAADRYQMAANEGSNDPLSLDALHFSGRIAEVALKDTKRAGEIYRKEADMARQIIDKVDSPKEAEPVKIRLARALASAGLLERNPKMLQQATQNALTEGTQAAGQ